jgi:hypothetical protein
MFIDINENRTYPMNNEADLQAVIVDYLRQTDLLFTATLGGTLSTPQSRIKAWQQGYQKGVLDIMIYSPSGDGKYKGFGLELKTVSGLGKISPNQQDWMTRLEIESGWFSLCSNDLIVIIETLTKYIHGVL